MADFYVVTRNDTLAHSGSFGMKWHNRRYQNEDGTYTEEGKARKRAAYANGKRAEQAFRDAKPVVDNAKKIGDALVERSRHQVSTTDVKIEELSDDELARLVKRLNNEKTFKSLTTKEVTDKGAERLKFILETLGTVVTIASGAAGVYAAFNKLEEDKKG